MIPTVRQLFEQLQNKKPKEDKDFEAFWQKYSGEYQFEVLPVKTVASLSFAFGRLHESKMCRKLMDEIFSTPEEFMDHFEDDQL